jgi:hypothetical protein
MDGKTSERTTVRRPRIIRESRARRAEAAASRPIGPPQLQRATTSRPLATPISTPTPEGKGPLSGGRTQGLELAVLGQL